jgi:hypothetical protein
VLLHWNTIFGDHPAEITQTRESKRSKIFSAGTRLTLLEQHLHILPGERLEETGFGGDDAFVGKFVLPIASRCFY